MENIIEPTMDYDFNKIQLGLPISQPASSYLTRIFVDNKPLFIQATKCTTKNGFIKSGKKIYCDLMFSNKDSIFIHWIENLENKCQDLIHQKGEMWFQNKMEKEDIEVAFSSPLKIYKSGAYYLMRASVKPNIKIFNDTNTEVAVENIQPDTNIISIIEVQGIKFTSRNFQIEFEVKQCMIVSPDPFLDNCFIRTSGRSERKDIFDHKDLEKKESTIVQPNIDEIVQNILNIRKNATKEPMSLGNVDISEQDTKSNISQQPNHTLPILSETKGLESSTITKTIESVIPKTNNLQKEHLEKPITNVPFPLVNDDDLMEINIDVDLNTDAMTLKKPNHVHQQKYNVLIETARKAKTEYKTAYLEAKQLMETYMLDPYDDDDNFGISDSEEEYSEEEEDFENDYEN
jgi:hypothetical protein